MLNKYNANIRARELAKLIYEIRKDGLQVSTTSNGSIAVVNRSWQYETNVEVRDKDNNILPCYYTEIGVGCFVSLPHGKDNCIIPPSSLPDNKIYAQDFNMVVSDPNGQFVSISEINDMIKSGVIMLNRHRLKEYKFDTTVTYDKDKYTKEEAMKLFGDLI